MIKSFLARLEDPKRPLLAPNYWIMEKIGLLLPKNTLGKAFYVIIHEIVTLFVVTQYIELYIIRSDLDLVLTNMKISMLSVVCVVKANTFVFWQKDWRQVFNYITDSDKLDRTNPDKEKREIIEKYTKYCRQLTYFYWGLVFLTFLTTVFQPLIVYLSLPIFRENFRNGTEPFPHIFSSWMPFDKNHSPGNYITIVWHTLLTAYGAFVMASYDSSVVVTMMTFGGKLDLLRDRCKKIVGTTAVGISNDEAALIIKELHHIHLMLIKHSRLFNSLLSPVMFFYMVMCGLALCASAYQLTIATSTAQKVLLAEYLVFGVAQLFLFCWHSNIVLVKNENMLSGPYESAWWTASLKQRKDLIILSGQLRIRNKFTAGPFAELTLSTFIAILKGAYSYYTLLSKKR